MNLKNKLNLRLAMSLLFCLLLGAVQPVMAQTYIKASNAEESDFFAIDIDLSGQTLIVGAPGEDSSALTVNGDQEDNASSGMGAAYIFVHEGGNWTQQAYLKVSNPSDYPSTRNWGQRVAVSGDLAVMTSWWAKWSADGPAGGAYIFERDGESWSELQLLRHLEGSTANSFGYSVAISGDTIVIGDPSEQSNTTGIDPSTNEALTNSGAVYVYVRDGDSFTRQAFIKAPNTGDEDWFGMAVDIDGDTLVVGARHEDSNLTGVDNPAADNDLAADSGAAYVYIRNGGTWSLQGYLKASNTGVGDWFGTDVAVSGDSIAVSAFREDSSTVGVNGEDNDDLQDSGAVYVFNRDGSSDWSQHSYIKTLNQAKFDGLGAVSLSGDVLTVGRSGDDELVTDSGAAFVFTRDEFGDWSELGKLKPTNPGLSDRMGVTVAVDGDLLAGGTYLEDSNLTGIDNPGTDNELADSSGAVYAIPVSQLNAVDNVPPDITAPENIFAPATGELTMVELGEPVASDNSGTVSAITNDAPAGGFPLGVTVVTWTATDPSGNEGTDTQDVTIFEVEPEPCHEDAIFCSGFEEGEGIPDH